MSKNSIRYVPILKAKQGEFGALEVLKPPVKKQLRPLIDVIRVPLDKRKQPLENHLSKLAEKIEVAWASKRPFYLDVFDLPLDSRTSTGEHPLLYLGARLLSRELNIVPAVGLDRDSGYLQAVKELVARTSAVLIRLLPEDMEFPNDLSDKLSALIASIEVKEEQAHLLLDLRSLEGIDLSESQRLVTQTLRGLPRLRSYELVIVGAGSMPQGLSEVAATDSIVRIRRKEVELWKKVATRPLAHPNLTFGDYGIVHPDSLDLDPRKITLSASIRYTSGRDVLVLRGRAFKTHPDGYGQYHALANSLVSMPEYMGRAFSWGDERVSECARRKCKTGNLTTWVKVATSHHLTTVVSELGPP